MCVVVEVLGLGWFEWEATPRQVVQVVQAMGVGELRNRKETRGDLNVVDERRAGGKWGRVSRWPDAC